MTRYTMARYTRMTRYTMTRYTRMTRYTMARYTRLPRRPAGRLLSLAGPPGLSISAPKSRLRGHGAVTVRSRCGVRWLGRGIGSHWAATRAVRHQCSLGAVQVPCRCRAGAV
jgi:hypothetical protein